MVGRVNNDAAALGLFRSPLIKKSREISSVVRLPDIAHKNGQSTIDGKVLYMLPDWYQVRRRLAWLTRYVLVLLAGPFKIASPLLHDDSLP